MEKLFGLLSSFAQDKEQQAASPSSAATSAGSAVSTAGGETPSSSGSGMLHTTSSVGQAGQVQLNRIFLVKQL